MRGGTGHVHADVMSYDADKAKAWYSKADNDADNFDPALNSSHADYFKNPDSSVAYGENRWKSGGGIQGDHKTGLSAGNTRDVDGTVDRVRDPPKELLPFLYAVKCQASAYNISLDAAFEAAGGHARGTIPTTRFCSTLVSTFHRMEFTDELMAQICMAYGTGDRPPAGSNRALVVPYECIAWKDFIEDVTGAKDVLNAPGKPGGPKPMYPRGVQYG